MANYLTYGTHLRQDSQFLHVSLPGDEPDVTISDAFKETIQRLRYTLVGPSIAGFDGPNIRGSSQGGASVHQPRPDTQQQMSSPKPVQPRLLGDMDSGAPQCAIPVHDPSKGGDMMKWCSYDHTSTPSLSSLFPVFNLMCEKKIAKNRRCP